GRAADAQRAVLAPRDAGDDRFHVHRADARFAPDGFAAVLLAANGDIFARHVFAHVTAVEQLDAREPFHPGDAEPAGHDQPQRRAVAHLQRPAVHLVSEQNVVALQRVAEREAAREVLRVVLVAAVFYLLIGAE